MLTVYDLAGNVEPLVGITSELERIREVNGDRSISFSVTRTAANAVAFDMLESETIAETEDGEQYRIKDVSPELKGKRMTKKIIAEHIFFDIIDSKVTREDARTGSFSVDSMLSFVLSRAGWTFVIEFGDYYAESWENFGGDNCLKLFTQLVERYNFEYIPKAKEKKVYVYGQIGVTTDVQIRYNHNLQALKANFNTDNLSTIGTAYGQAETDEEGNVLSQIKATFRHPNADVFGERWAPDWEDQRYTSEPTLEAAIARKLIAEPEFTLEADYVELVKNGMKLYDFEEGDDLFVLHERYDFDFMARVLKIVDYPYSKGKKQPKLTISNLRRNVKDRLSQTIRRSIEAQKNALNASNKATLSDIKANAAIVNAAEQQARLDLITDENGNMTTASRLLYMNSHVYADHTGIWAVDPQDPTRYAHHGAGGSDYVKGMIRIVRPDGYEVMNDGISAYDVNIQAITKPMFHGPGVAEVQRPYSVWMRSRSSQSLDYNQYRMKRVGRFLKIVFRLMAGGGENGDPLNTAYLEVWMNGQVVATASTTEADDFAPAVINGSTLTVDMGVPNGARDSFQIRMRSSVAGANVYAIVSEYWMEG